MIQRIARIVLMTGLFFVPIIPLIVSNSLYFPFITGKAFVFRIVVELCLIAWALLALKDPVYRPRKSWIMWAFLAFVVVMGLATAFGESPLRSFWSNFERMEGFVTLLHLLAYFVVAGVFLNTRVAWEKWFSVSVGVSAVVGLYVLGQTAGMFGPYTAGMRLGATFGNPTYLAVYVLFHIFLTLWLLYRTQKGRFIRVGYVIALLLQVFSLYHTATRGTILGVVGGLGLSALLVAIFGKAHPRLRRYSAGAIVVLILAVGGIFMARNSTFVKESPVLSRFASISVTETTTESRFILWKEIAWEGFKEHPLLGWGQDNFIQVFSKHYDPQMYRQEPWFDRAHNVFLDWLVAGGVLGLLGYLMLFGIAVVFVWKLSRLNVVEKSLFTGLLAGYFFHNLFVFDNLVSYIFFVSLLACVHAVSIEEREKTKERDAKKPLVLSAATQQIGMIAVVVLGVWVLYAVNVPGIVKARGLVDALSGTDIGKIYTEYDAILAQGFLGREEIRENIAQTALRALRSELPEEAKRDITNRALIELQQEVIADPTNTRPLYFLGKLLSDAKNYTDAVEVFNAALAINPERQIFLLEKGVALRAQELYQESFDTFKTAYESAPDFGEARIQYIVAANLVGNQEVVRTELSALNQYLVENPADAETHFLLGTIYLNIGQNENAIIHFQQAMDLDQDFAEQGKAIIDAIRAGHKVNFKNP